MRHWHTDAGVCLFPRFPAESRRITESQKARGPAGPGVRCRCWVWRPETDRSCQESEGLESQSEDSVPCPVPWW